MRQSRFADLVLLPLPRSGEFAQKVGNGGFVYVVLQFDQLRDQTAFLVFDNLRHLDGMASLRQCVVVDPFDRALA